MFGGANHIKPVKLLCKNKVSKWHSSDGERLCLLQNEHVQLEEATNLINMLYLSMPTEPKSGLRLLYKGYRFK